MDWSAGMGWLALKFPQANLYMSAQGSALTSMELRSREGRGFTAAGGEDGAGICWATQGATMNRMTAEYMSAIAIFALGMSEVILRADWIMQGSP